MTTDTEITGPSREEMNAWLTANCGRGLPHDEATDEATMLHGLAYILRQIEGTNKYTVHIGQCGPATSALRMALDHFARKALAHECICTQCGMRHGGRVSGDVGF